MENIANYKERDTRFVTEELARQNKSPLKKLVDILALFWKPTVFFTCFYTFVVVFGLAGIFIQKQTKTSSTPNETVVTIVYENMTFHVTNLAIFESDSLLKVSQTDLEQNKALFDEIDVNLKFIFNEALISTEYFCVKETSRMLIDAALTFRYEKSELNATQSLAIVIARGLRRFTNSSIIQLKLDGSLAVILSSAGEDTLSISNQACYSVTQKVESNYLMQNNTCSKCMYDLEGQRVKYCNTTINLLYFLQPYLLKA